MLHMLYPALCEGCAKPLIAAEEVLCIGCEQQLPETKYHHAEDNETALRFAGRVPFHYATSYAFFTADGLLQHLIHELKYRDKKDIGPYLGAKFGRSLQPVPHLRGIDMVIPVPLHPAKKAFRGYNQAMLIAEGIAKQLGIPASEQLLRIRETESQTNKSRSERVNNMQGAFRVKDMQQLAGKHILLVDDVLTTGATLEACAHALMAVENIKISFATIGIAVS
ncbi:MAG: ComF family protein [Bacteroidota bacterium]